MKIVIAGAVALVLTAPARAEQGFEEFDHTTLNFDVPHVVPAGATVCQDAQSPELQTFEQRRCKPLEKAIKVKLVVIAHGITEPQFFFHAEKGSFKGWTTRANLQ